ncbi:MAG: restriction endonuclease [Actinomycetia bacterium]|nr:restriction endonuclease [Actinomycetes bacterium]
MTDVDWFVMIAALDVASAGVSWYGYRRSRRLVLSPADLEFAVVDPLSAAGFTRYCAALVRLLGYQRVRRARGGALNLTATAPDGTLVAIRCARQKEPVAADAVRALRQGITAGGHPGRAGILVTSALVTPEARALAADTGITVADRAVLRHWMELARAGGLGGTLAADGTSAGAIARTRTAARARAVDTLVMGSMVGCAALVLIAVVVHAATGTAAPRIAAARTAAASVAAANTSALTPAGTVSTSNPGSTAGAASGGDAAGRDRHVLHVKHVLHVEHMRHVEYVEHHAPGQQG